MKHDHYTRRSDRFGELLCTLFLTLAAAYFAGVTLIAWLDGRFATEAIKAVAR